MMDKKELLAKATRAAAAAIFGRDPAIIVIERNNGTIARACWNRPEDDQPYAIEGKIVGVERSRRRTEFKGGHLDDITFRRRLVWRYRLDTNAFGRWRDHRTDPFVTVADDGSVTVTGLSEGEA